MSVEREQVRRVAELARLALSEDELDRFTPQLSDILDHIDALAGLELDDDEARDEITPAPLRPEDAAPDALERSPEDMAPEWRDGFYVVPRLSAQERPPVDDAGGPDGADR